MSGIRAQFEQLPARLRWILIGLASGLLLLLIGSGVWSWLGRREAIAQQALGAVVASVQRATASGQPAELDAAQKALTEFLAQHGRSREAPQAWYLLGQVEFQRGQWDAAVGAFSEAAARRSTDALGALSLLGKGYAYESKGEPGRALEVFQQALAGRGPKDFLYGDLLLAKARAQEQAKDSTGAIATYTQYVKDLPSSDRIQNVRIRLALLGGAS